VSSRLRFWITAICLGACLDSLQAANYPLQILIPRAIGTSPDSGGPTIPSAHRIFWAYPAVPYNIRAAVIGGAYPFTYALQNAPAGMTINSTTGEINWPNPQTDAASITLRVTDAENTTVQTSWSIDVDASRFIFVQASASNGGNGSFASPYNRISAIPTGTHVGRIVYFRTGVYSILDMPRTNPGDVWARVDLSAASFPLVWLAYPGEQPIIDFGYTGAPGYVPFIRMSGSPVHFEGLETRNSQIMVLQFTTNHYAVVRKNNMHNQGPASGGSNASFIMTIRGGGVLSHYEIFQDNLFHENDNTSCIKLYSRNKTLIEDNSFYNMTTNPAEGEGECVAFKDSAVRFTLRRNLFYNLGSMNKSIGGNMAADDATTTGEILFNNVRGGSIAALDVNQHSLAGVLHVYRNTFNGPVRFRNVDSSDGPFHLYNNVIVNSESGWPAGSHIGHMDVEDASRIVLTNNLAGFPADGLINANGNLQGSYRTQYLGLRGHELATGTPPPPPPPGSRCDVSGNGSTDVIDVQQCVNQVINPTVCSTGDINQDGSCTVVDIQRVVNAALGGACVTQ
jgi:hypothetical protein